MDDLQGRYLLCRVLVDGDAEAIIFHADASIRVDGYLDSAAAPGQCFVDGVIDNFKDEMVQSFKVGTADIHAGSAANRFQPLQNLDVPGVIVNGRGVVVLLDLGGHMVIVALLGLRRPVTALPVEMPCSGHDRK